MRYSLRHGPDDQLNDAIMILKGAGYRVVKLGHGRSSFDATKDEEHDWLEQRFAVEEEL